MAGATDYFINIFSRSIQSYAPCFNPAAKSTLAALYKFYIQLFIDFQPFSLLFTAKKFQGHLHFSLTVKYQFFNNIPLLDYDQKNKN